MSHWASGVTVVTTRDKDGNPYGLTVSSFTSVSLEPILVLVCLDKRLSGMRAFEESMNFGVSILSESQEEVSRIFAKKDSVRPSELYFSGETGIPLICHSLATLECDTIATYPGGDHVILLGQVRALQHLESKAGKTPLLYCRGKYCIFPKE